MRAAGASTAPDGPKRTRLALIGFGTVGQGFAQILAERGDALAARHGLEVVVTAVSDFNRGSVYRAAGFDPRELLGAADALETLEADAKGWDALTTISESGADAVAELSFTDLKTGEPALTHVREALSRGMDVITTNKGPIALAFAELRKLAAEHGAGIGVEGTVMSGTPTLAVGAGMLAGAGVTRIQGILNGTTNYILTRMEAGLDFDTALAEAQREGYAEADPSGDVDGIDAAGKVVILANLVMDAPITMADVERRGIRDVSAADVAAAAEAGERWKLIGSVERRADGGVSASVGPVRLPLAHPLAGVGGAVNACTFTTDLLGDVTIQGPGAGRLATGYALVEDLIALRGRAPQGSGGR
ncbi:MAG TPA: homoserine dehydrogenase [Trueperaceae bacterium]|nr:homoserine dehydrogenase [Trueperaceae bacterium]